MLSHPERAARRYRLASRRVREGSPSAAFWRSAWFAFLAGLYL
jgi:hypothetical protein